MLYRLHTCRDRCAASKHQGTAWVKEHSEELAQALIEAQRQQAKIEAAVQHAAASLQQLEDEATDITKRKSQLQAQQMCASAAAATAAARKQRAAEFEVSVRNIQTKRKVHPSVACLPAYVNGLTASCCRTPTPNGVTSKRKHSPPRSWRRQRQPRLPSRGTAWPQRE